MNSIPISEIKNLGREKLKELCQTNPDLIVDIIFALLDKVEEQQATIEKLTLRVKELEDKLNTNSNNSSKPPSSDPLNVKYGKKREKSGKKKGGQPGHTGTTLKLFDTCDKTILTPHISCPHCKKNLKNIPVLSVNRRQVVDIPPPQKYSVTEFQTEDKKCPNCGKISSSDFSPNLTQCVQYGDNLKTFVIFLHDYNLIPFKKISEIVQELYQLQISEGTIANIITDCYKKLDGFEKTVKEMMLKSEVLHFDETGINIDGTLNWVHSTSSDLLTLFFSDTRRGKEAIDRINILPNYTGIAKHDCWKPYFKYINCTHSLCMSHILRELSFINERYQQTWSLFMKNLLKEACAEKNTGTLKYEDFRERIRLILLQAEKENPEPVKPTNKKDRIKKGKPRLLYERFVKYYEAIFAFMTNSKVPFTNNLVERDQRMIKVQQKISGSFRSVLHAQYFCRIRSYISTVKKNNQNIFNSIFSVFAGHPFIPQL